MSDYGQVIDEYAAVSDDVYQLFVDYLKDPVFVKVKDDLSNPKEHYSMYVSKAYCLLSRECRFVIVFALADSEPVGKNKRLSQLSWISFQMRTLPDNYDAPTHGYSFPATGPLYEAKINKTGVTKAASTYDCETLPLVVTLLHTERKTEKDYQKRGNLLSAMVTWETIITFKSL